MITRRHLLAGVTASIAFYPACASCQPYFKGCSITVDQADALLGSEQVWIPYNAVQVEGQTEAKYLLDAGEGVGDPAYRWRWMKVPRFSEHPSGRFDSDNL
jgi:hypothetical protein